MSNRTDAGSSDDVGRLLIVEDDAVDRLALRRMLETIESRTHLRFEVTEAESLAEAQQAIERDDWDWILSDHELGDGSGADVMASLDRKGSAAALIFLTGHGDESLAADLLRRGARDYLTKDRLTPQRLQSSLLTASALLRAERIAELVSAGNELLADVGAQLVESVEFDDVARAIVSGAIGRFAEFAVLDAQTPEGATRRVDVAHLDAALESSAREAAVGLVPSAAWRRAVHRDEAGLLVRLVNGTDDLPADSFSSDWLAAVGASELLSIPLLAGGRDVGVLTFGRTAGRRFSGTLVPAILRRYSGRAAVALENAALYEQLRAAIAAREEVLGIVAHDLRNPLNAIVGATTNLLALELEPDVQKRQLELVESAAGKMTRLVDDLLDVAQLEDGVLTVTPASVAPAALIEAACRLLDARAVESEVAIVRAAAPDLPSVWVDEVRGIQILTNLIDNAIRHSPSGGVVTVAADPGNGDVRFRVRDEGPGLPEEEIALLFRRFWQGGRRKGRAGIGLTISQALVNSHGGEIEAERVETGGLEFRFTVPCDPPEVETESG